tara:strand:- start:154 stop:657 length:504 start_codon:yes stop_codon:yes gene_type:complete
MNKHEDFWQITCDSLDKSMQVFNIDKEMRNELLGLYKNLSIFPEVKKVLNNLNEKDFKLAILSNGTPSLLNELVSSNNLENIFDDVLSIEEVKTYKPHPNVYNIPIKRYKINKNNVAYLSANTWDVSAAGNYGFNAVWVNRNNSVFDNLDYVPKHEIKHLGELLDKI